MITRRRLFGLLGGAAVSPLLPATVEPEPLSKRLDEIAWLKPALPLDMYEVPRLLGFDFSLEPGSLEAISKASGKLVMLQLRRGGYISVGAAE